MTVYLAVTVTAPAPLAAACALQVISGPRVYYSLRRAPPLSFLFTFVVCSRSSPIIMHPSLAAPAPSRFPSSSRGDGVYASPPTAAPAAPKPSESSLLHFGDSLLTFPVAAASTAPFRIDETSRLLLALGAPASRADENSQLLLGLAFSRGQATSAVGAAGGEVSLFPSHFEPVHRSVPIEQIVEGGIDDDVVSVGEGSGADAGAGAGMGVGAGMGAKVANDEVTPSSPWTGMKRARASSTDPDIVFTPRSSSLERVMKQFYAALKNDEPHTLRIAGGASAIPSLSGACLLARERWTALLRVLVDDSARVSNGLLSDMALLVRTPGTGALEADATVLYAVRIPAPPPLRSTHDFFAVSARAASELCARGAVRTGAAVVLRVPASALVGLAWPIGAFADDAESVSASWGGGRGGGARRSGVLPPPPPAWYPTVTVHAALIERLDLRELVRVTRGDAGASTAGSSSGDGGVVRLEYDVVTVPEVVDVAHADPLRGGGGCATTTNPPSQPRVCAGEHRARPDCVRKRRRRAAQVRGYDARGLHSRRGGEWIRRRRPRQSGGENEMIMIMMPRHTVTP